jgi:hypothetical protein
VGEKPVLDYRGREFRRFGWRPSPQLFLLMIAAAVVLIPIIWFIWVIFIYNPNP